MITSLAFLLVMMADPALLYSTEGRSNQDNALAVQGLGYPPIKTQSAAQARMMAKRAAIIDAYRNALLSGGGANYNEDNFYVGISGFVKDMTITEEEYLNDGGMRITIKVPLKSIAVTSGTAYKKPQENRPGLSKVSLNEWYRIIESMVRFENKN